MTIHILFHGLPICGFSREVPANWPEGHKWISIDDRELHQHLNCEGCKQALASSPPPKV